VEQASQQCGTDRKRRVRHDVEGSAGESEVGGIGLDDGQVAAETGSEVRGATGVAFDGDHPRARRQQWRGERAPTGADVEDEVTPTDAGLAGDAFSPGGIEPVPTPRPPGAGHGGGG